jgi:acyl-lipid (7-3)-desaturase (Delta-4 desaturase)
MGPDADNLRQRNVSVVNKNTIASTSPELQLRADVTKLQPNEVAIDGIIYNLDTFVHPGGETIKIFGGNDVTVQYRMIHPYHTAKHLEKMQCVGKVADYSCE